MAQIELRGRVVFQKKIAARNDLGSAQGGAFADQFDRAANIMPRLGGETVMAGRLEGRNTVTIRVRQDSETRLVNSDWRARDNNDAARLFNIRSKVDPFEGGSDHGKYFDLLAEEGAES